MIFITWCRNKLHKQGTLQGSICVERSSEGFAGTPPTQSRLCGLPVQSARVQRHKPYSLKSITTLSPCTYKDVNKAPKSSLSDQKGMPLTICWLSYEPRLITTALPFHSAHFRLMVYYAIHRVDRLALCNCSWLPIELKYLVLSSRR